MKEIYTEEEPPRYSHEEVWGLCQIAMNRGMTLRQDQLQGYGSDKSGNEILQEWFEIIKNRKNSGLDVLK